MEEAERETECRGLAFEETKERQSTEEEDKLMEEAERETE